MQAEFQTEAAAEPMPSDFQAEAAALLSDFQGEAIAVAMQAESQAGGRGSAHGTWHF